MAGRVIRFPSDWRKRWHNRMGNRAVPCEVSNRWLALPEAVEQVGKQELMVVDVMTLDSNEKPHKLCELVLDRQELLNALGFVAKPASTD